MRALYLFLDRTTGVGRPRHTADESLTPIRTGAFAAWMASAPASQRARLQVIPGGLADQGTEQGAAPSNVAGGIEAVADRGTPRRRTGSSRSAARRRASSATCTASWPPNGASPSRTSATPDPSVPGQPRGDDRVGIGPEPVEHHRAAGEDDDDEPIDQRSHRGHDVEVGLRQARASPNRPAPSA